MAQNASDSQKVDYLWKKIVYGAAKTDISGNIDATNEPNPSPLQIRADKILQQSDQIPTVIPGSSSGVVTVYPTTSPIECTSTAGIPTPTLTWQTGRTFWVPPEFGSTYQIKVYIAPSGNAANVASKGTQVFATGSGFNDLWVFDYQAGILNFNSNNTPYASGAPISFTGNSVYISGAVYAGAFGLPTVSSGSVGNLTISNVTISANISAVSSSSNIILSAAGAGAVQFTGNAIGIPSGTTAQRPTTVAAGYIRFNTDTNSLEIFDGSNWDAGSAALTSQILNGDGSSNTFTLSSNVNSATDLIVSINGTVQQPTTAYSVNGTNITFTETPIVSDIIEVRHIASGISSIGSLALGSSNIAIPVANGAIDFTTNGTLVLQLGTTGAIISTYPNTVITSSGVATNVDVFSTSVYRTAKYIFQANTSSTYESSEVLVTHDGSTAYRTVYAVIGSGASLGNVSTTVSSGNVLVQYTAANNNTNVRTLKQYIVI